MIKISSFLNGKNLCNIFANSIVEKINDLSPNAKTQITVINVGGFFIVKGQTSSENVVNLSDILSNIYKKYDDSLTNTVRVIDTIFYNKVSDSDYLFIEFSENKIDKRLTTNLTKTCNELQKDGVYLNLKVDETNKIIYYDLDPKKDFNNLLIESKFSNYTCIKDDFSQNVYISDDIYGLSNEGVKNYHYLIRKISYNLLERGLPNDLTIQISSDKKLIDIDVENINLNINGKLTVFKDSLESLVLDNFEFELNDLSNSFKSTNYDVIDSFINESVPKIWENSFGAGDLMFL